jgi:hypothetical protein
MFNWGCVSSEIFSLVSIPHPRPGLCGPSCTSKLESRVVTTAKTCASRPTKEFGLETASCQKYPPMSIRPFLGPRAEACESGLHRIAAFSAPPKKGITGHQFESFRRQTHWPVFAAGILRRRCRLSRTGCCGARECGTSRNFGLEARASMLALRKVNFSSHGASGVPILKTFSSGSWSMALGQLLWPQMES